MADTTSLDVAIAAGGVVASATLSYVVARRVSIESARKARALAEDEARREARVELADLLSTLADLSANAPAETYMGQWERPTGEGFEEVFVPGPTSDIRSVARRCVTRAERAGLPDIADHLDREVAEWSAALDRNSLRYRGELTDFDRALSDARKAGRRQQDRFCTVVKDLERDTRAIIRNDAK